MTKTEWLAGTTFFIELYKISFCNWKKNVLILYYLLKFKIVAHEYHVVVHLCQSCIATC